MATTITREQPALRSAPMFLTEAELAERWRVTSRTVQRLVRDGALPATAIRRSTRFALEDVEHYEAAHRTAPARQAPSSLPPRRESRHYGLCIAHRKGGQAKTTTVWYLARELARAGKRVLLRDLDPQEGLTDILRDHGSPDGRFTRRIALVPSGGHVPFRPDIELIDTPPALDDSLPGIDRADAVVIPVIPEHQAVRALEKMLLLLADHRRDHPSLQVLGVVPTRIHARWPAHTEFLEEIHELAAQLGATVLPPIPESHAVMRYSLEGRLWRPLAQSVLVAMAEHHHCG